VWWRVGKAWVDRWAAAGVVPPRCSRRSYTAAHGCRELGSGVASSAPRIPPPRYGPTDTPNRSRDYPPHSVERDWTSRDRKGWKALRAREANARTRHGLRGPRSILDLLPTPSPSRGQKGRALPELGSKRPRRGGSTPLCAQTRREGCSEEHQSRASEISRIPAPGSATEGTLHDALSSGVSAAPPSLPNSRHDSPFGNPPRGRG
jgi:hypothetical protein